MQKVIGSALLVLLAFASFSATPGKKDVWQTWEQVIALNNETPKPIFIDMYTNWCHYCKVMDATTYKNDSVVSFLKQHFYRFKFNAEGKDTINWQGKTFTYNPRYGINDFGVYLTRGNIVYPTTIIITPGGQPFYKHGQISSGEMEMLLKFFSSPNSGKKSLEEFAANFKPAW
jgi:uncharacterized protein YyaL (SSP411 family)